MAKKKPPKELACVVCGLPIDPVAYPRHPSHDLPEEKEPTR